MLPGKVRQDEFEAFKNSYESYPLQFYCPNGKQEEFINTVAHCNENVDTPVVLVTFGNGTDTDPVAIKVFDVSNMDCEPSSAVTSTLDDE